MHPVYILLLAVGNINDINGQVKGGTLNNNLNLKHSETMLLECERAPSGCRALAPARRRLFGRPGDPRRSAAGEEQPGWNNELHSADEPRNAVRRLQETHGIPLCARTLLPADPHVSARIPASEILPLVELAEFHGVSSSQPPSRHLWLRAFPILGFAALDRFPPSDPVRARRYSLDLRPSLSQDLQSLGTVTLEIRSDKYVSPC
jgi:hypothetical protein